MSKVAAAIINTHSITLVIDGQTTPITDSHPNYTEIRTLAAAGKYDNIDSLLNLTKAIVDFGAGRVTVKDGIVMFDGVATHNAVTTRILDMVDEGLEVAPMLKFLENLMQNPSFRSVQELYGFLEVNDLPITEDGCFLAYRKCTHDWKDHHTKTMDNSIGAVVTMPRNMVDEDSDRTCSNGLHVCAQGYLGSFGNGEGGRTLLVKVNPKDVVAVPKDYNNAKMRVCEFTVLREVNPKIRGNAYTGAVYKPEMVSANTLASADMVITRDEAIIRLGLQGKKNPNSALRKRLKRGKTAKEVFVNGVSMVQIIDGEAPAEVADDSVMTHDDAMFKFGIDKAALRKRLNRGATMKRVYVNGVEMVKVLAD